MLIQKCTGETLEVIYSAMGRANTAKDCSSREIYRRLLANNENLSSRFVSSEIACQKKQALFTLEIMYFLFFF